ncbi:MAG: hypothetical protein QJR03_07295 [Sphaerobacter sp.]|nr:hypothetical protein [Sphaerobacter sp.]
MAVPREAAPGPADALPVIDALIATQRALAECLIALRAALGQGDLAAVSALLRDIPALCARADDLQAELDGPIAALRAPAGATPPTPAALAARLQELDRELGRVRALRRQLGDLIAALSNVTHASLTAVAELERRLGTYRPGAAPATPAGTAARPRLLDQTA